MATKYKRPKVKRSKRNFDIVSTAAALSAAQSARQLGLSKKIGSALAGPRRGHNPDDVPDVSIGHIDFIDYGSIERYLRDGVIYHAFTSTPVFADGYRMGAPWESAEQFAQQNPAKFDRCVRDVQARSAGKANAYAVCTAAGTRNPSGLFIPHYFKQDQGKRYRVRGDRNDWVIEDTRDGYAYGGHFEDPRHAQELADEWNAEIEKGNNHRPATAQGTRNPNADEWVAITPKHGRWEIPGKHDSVTSAKYAFMSAYPNLVRDSLHGSRLPGVKFKKVKIRRNPEADANAVYEDFHGTPPAETLVYKETLHFHGHLGGLADLVHIVVKIIGGKKDGQELQLNAPDPSKASESDIVRLTANEARNQLYFTGGDQSLNLKALGFRDSFDINHDGETFEATEIKDNMVIGSIYRIMYRTEKAFDDFDTIDYHHEAGEDTGLMPFLTYDTLNDKMGVAGGSYVIHEKGIVN